MVPVSEWKWYGTPGHFICSYDCRFHMATRVGVYLVSTVGEYFPDAPIREILAESRGIVLSGRGDARRSDYIQKVGYEEIGYGRTYETMVFRIAGECTCGCGMPAIDGEELDFAAYNDRKSANIGHFEMCLKASEMV